jgi:8-oxo-dGTP pyrophosphatase MutT (NUDIX family)
MSHLHEKVDFTVEVFVVYDGKVLIRKHDKYDMWISVGGHIELDEDPNEAAIREVKEEVGLDITLGGKSFSPSNSDLFRELIVPFALNRHRISESHEHISLVYWAEATTDVVISERENDEWRWCTKFDIRSWKELNEDIRGYALYALNQASMLR